MGKKSGWVWLFARSLGGSGEWGDGTGRDRTGSLGLSIVLFWGFWVLMVGEVMEK